MGNVNIFGGNGEMEWIGRYIQLSSCPLLASLHKILTFLSETEGHLKQRHTTGGKTLNKAGGLHGGPGGTIGG